MTIKKILEYRGNDHYFCAFCQNECDKFFVVFARTNGIEFESSTEYNELNHLRMVKDEKKQFIVPLKKCFYIWSVEDVKEYETICRVLDAVWSD